VARKQPTPPRQAVAAIPLEEERLLRAVVETPDDDAVRLIYADWLEEHGDEPRRVWAEFIREQCRVFREPLAPRELHKVRTRLGKLFQQHGADWVGPHIRVGPDDFHRGFATNGELLAEPTGEVLADLLGRPALAALVVHVGGQNADNVELFRLVSQAPRLAAVKRLRCREAGDAGEPRPSTALLLSSPYLVGLEELCLCDNGIHDADLRTIAANPALTSLRTLDLGRSGAMEVSGNPFTDVGLAALAKSPHLGALETLVVSDATNVTARGVLTVLRSARLGRIEELDIRGISLDDEGAARVAACAGAARLKRLYLGRWYYQEANLGDAAALALAASRHLRGLEQLRLDRMSLSEQTVAALRRTFGERVEMG
jgi:uncharacterized protein (TIGR02996 family)